MALGRLGLSSTITDLELDLSTEAKIVKRHFRHSLDYLLEQHFWNFARKSAQLILQFKNPEPAFAFSYYMPADALVIRQIAPYEAYVENIEMYPDQKIPYTEIFVGTTKLMYTNCNNAWAKYTRRVDTNDVFPTHFGRALAAQLSMDIAPSLITSNYPKIKDALNNNALNDISGGIADDLAKQPQYKNSESSFIRCRW